MTLDAVALEVMGHAFAAVAEEMGLVLIHSALSPNIRERRDCSAALFEADGAMIAQAAHIPVHLGALAESVTAVRALEPAPRPGETFILNDPFTGGSHLPDITLIGAAGLTASDWLEGDGVDDADVPITVRIDIREGAFHADFTGTAPAVRGNLNCPLAVTRSAALFVVRTLLPEDVPTNAGVQRAVRVTAPEGCLVNARHPSAVAAGNVETSQRIVDTLFLALARGGIDVPAQGQGTMNNVTFGGQLAPGNGQRSGGATGGWTYYETIGGGQGASQGALGPSGVHVGMSNTRNTPVEVLEMEYPLRLKTYALRRGSGGVGRWAGGEGVIREFAALAPMKLSVLAERRRHCPAGAAGGGHGAAGRTILNGTPLAPKASTLLEPGDVLRIETPGGGGWGTPE